MNRALDHLSGGRRPTPADELLALPMTTAETAVAHVLRAVIDHLGHSDIDDEERDAIVKRVSLLAARAESYLAEQHGAS